MDEHYKQLRHIMYRNAVGQAMVEYMQTLTPDALAAYEELESTRILGQIVEIINDDSLSDPECFYYIAEIVQLLIANGIPVTRHEDCD